MGASRVAWSTTVSPVTARPPSTHRERLLDGLAQALREQEYAAITVASIVQRARTSKRTFYEHFSSKDECLVELLRQSGTHMVARIEESVDPDAEWPTQARQAIEAMVASVAEEPAVHLTWLRAAPTLGAEGRALSREVMSAFVALIESLADTPTLREAGVPPPDPTVAMVLVGGLRELIDIALEEGRDLHELVDAATEATVRLLGPR